VNNFQWCFGYTRRATGGTSQREIGPRLRVCVLVSQTLRIANAGDHLARQMTNAGNLSWIHSTSVLAESRNSEGESVEICRVRHQCETAVSIEFSGTVVECFCDESPGADSLGREFSFAFSVNEQ